MVASNGDRCEQIVKLTAGKPIKIDCPLKPSKEPPKISDGSAAPAPELGRPGSAAPQTSDAADDAGVPDGSTSGSGEPKPAAVSNAKGYVEVFSDPPAQVLVDYKPTGLTTPVTGQKILLSPGKHKITYVLGSSKSTFPIIVKPGEKTVLSKSLTPPQ